MNEMVNVWRILSGNRIENCESARLPKVHIGPEKMIA